MVRNALPKKNYNKILTELRNLDLASDVLVQEILALNDTNYTVQRAREYLGVAMATTSSPGVNRSEGIKRAVKLLVIVLAIEDVAKKRN